MPPSMPQVFPYICLARMTDYLTFLSFFLRPVRLPATVRMGFLWPPGLPAAGCGMALSGVLGRVEADAEKALETLREYCRFPTISANKRAQPETAVFVRRLLAEHGFQALESRTEPSRQVAF